MKKNIKVKIPAGVNNGSTLRVRGEGDVGPRGYALCMHPKLAMAGESRGSNIRGCSMYLKCLIDRFSIFY